MSGADDLQQTAPGRGERIAVLDVLRGLAVLGILLVNAPSFAMPNPAVDTPRLSPQPFDGVDVALWWVMEVFFRQKFVTLFTMLFGVSVFLVGGRWGDPQRSGVLYRRLFFLMLFGLAHGALLWSGDVLLLYAVVGFVMAFCRSLPAAWLGGIGLALFALGVGRLLQVEFDVQASPALRAGFEASSAAEVQRQLDAYTGSFREVQAVNFDQWWFATNFTFEFYALLTLGLMMVGLSLFRSGVLDGSASPRLYTGLVIAGAAALAVIGWNAADQATDGFPLETRAWDYLPNVTLAPVVTLGYVGLICLALRSRRLGWMERTLAPVGRMAFTNYIAQTLIFTTVFYGGRGLGLFGRLDWPEWTILVVVVWALQIAGSAWWLGRFRMGPLEWIWRRLSYSGVGR